MAVKKKKKKVVRKKAAAPKKAPTKAAKKTAASKGKRYSAEKQKQVLQEMQEKGLTLKEAAAQFGVSVPTLSNWRRKAKLTGKRGRKPGPRPKTGKTRAGRPRLARAATTKDQLVDKLLVKVGRDALEKGGFPRYAGDKALATFVAKLILENE